MLTLEALKQKLESTEDLQSVVKTMKALAAVNIRQYEKAVAALASYMKTVEMGLQIALGNRPGFSISARPSPKDALSAIIFGSDQGMCGQLNERIVSDFLDAMQKLNIRSDDRQLIAVGMRVMNRLEDEGQKVNNTYAVPSSVAGITPLVQNLLLEIERWQSDEKQSQIYLFYCRPMGGASYRPHQIHLLPIDHEWLKNLRKKEWPTRMLPAFSMSWEPLFSALIQQYLLVNLFRATAESLASENASRLASMQGAEKNIDAQLDDLHRQYHQQRQMSITEELLDIVSGFELLDSE
jgi:F-type H+-transporting ATPase subunit gamma